MDSWPWFLQGTRTTYQKLAQHYRALVAMKGTEVFAASTLPVLLCFR